MSIYEENQQQQQTMIFEYIFKFNTRNFKIEKITKT